MSLKYRMDNRTPEQFEEDIKTCTKIEREIINQYVSQVEEVEGTKISIEDNGVDNTGEVRKKVNSAVDFIIKIPVEVKFNKKMLNYFHIKKNQVHSYIKQGAYVLWVNGWETEQPVFTILKTQDLINIKTNQEPVSIWVFGGKKGYKLSAKNYEWKPL